MPPAETSFLDAAASPATARPWPIKWQAAAVLGKVDRVALAFVALLLVLAVYDRGQAWRTLLYSGVELAGIGPWLAASVVLAAAAKATGADSLVAGSGRSADTTGSS
jgi:hypothetical protein